MKKALVLLVSFICYQIVCHAQVMDEHYYFKNLSVQNGLSQNTVNAILQDKQGFMWFGTREECASMETEEEELQVFDILEKNVFYGMTGKFGPETDEQALDLRSDILKEEERENRMEKRALFYRRLREFFSLVRRQLKELYDILYSR